MGFLNSFNKEAGLGVGYGVRWGSMYSFVEELNSTYIALNSVSLYVLIGVEMCSK